MHQIGIDRVERSLWSDSRGVSSANVTILVIFAALAMPGFVALGDGLAENVTGQGGQAYRAGGPSSSEPWGGGAFTSAGGGDTGSTGGSYGEGGESSGNGGGDYWGGGDDILFDVSRPGATPWDGHTPQAPETFTGGPGDFGAWGGQEGPDGANPTQLASNEPGSYGEAPSASEGGSSNNSSSSPFDFDAFKNRMLDRFSAGSNTGNTGSGGAEGLVSSAAAASGGAQMTAHDAIDTLSEYLETNGGSLSLRDLQRLVEEGGDLGAAAEFILGDRAIREGLTDGGYSMSADDLAELAASLDSGAYKQDSWMNGDRRKLDASEIDLAIKNSETGNPPGWARNSAHVLGSDFDLLADTTGESGLPRMSSDTLEAVMNMNEQEWRDFQDSRGIDSNFTLEQVQSAARAAVESGLFDYLDAPPGMGAEANGLVGREMLLSFSDESQRQGDTWVEYLSDDNAAEASYADLRNEDGANLMDGEPLVLKEVEGELFLSAADRLREKHPQLASSILQAERLDQQLSMSASDVVQGAVGDCWMMSTVAGFAEFDQDVIANSIKQVGDNKFAVTLYDQNGEPMRPILVDNEFAASAYSPDGTLLAQTDTALYGAVLEKAMSQALDSEGTDDMMVLDGGTEARMHQMLTGEKPDVVLFQEINSGNATRELVSDLEGAGARVETSSEARLTQLSTWVDDGRTITVTSSPDVSVGYLTEGHSYTVMGVEGDKVLLRDPRGDEYGGLDGTADGVIEVSLDDFNNSFMSMTSSNKRSS